MDSTWTEWSEGSNCNTTCGKGYKVQVRACTVPLYGGKKCPAAIPMQFREVRCAVEDCPGTLNDFFSIYCIKINLI